LDAPAKPVEKVAGQDIPVTCSYRHIVYGIVVESEFRLKSIDEIAGGGAAAAVRIVLGSPQYFQARTRGLTTDPGDWLGHAVLPGGDVYMKLDDVFETIVSADGRDVVCTKLADVDDSSFEANLLNFVLSTSLLLQGEEPLHSTVVELDGRAVGLLGPSGAGKSTLAAFLIGQGAKLVTDDMLRVTFADGQAFAHAGANRLKLFDEPAGRFLPGAVGEGHWNAMSGKIMVRPHAPIARRHMPVPIAALFWLDDETVAPAEVTSTRLSGGDLVRAVTASAMNIRYFAPDRLKRQLRFAEQVARTVPVYALNYARDYPALERVADEIGRRAQI
jgi:hypothetical protein